MRYANLASALVLALTVTPAFAAASGQAKKSMKPVSDHEFLMNAAQGNMSEIELGKMAEARASNEAVKTFAKRMVTDHQKGLDSLKTVAANEKVTLPMTLSTEDQQLKDKLSKLSGAAFDHAYMNAMVTDHRQDVAEFRTESMHAKASDVKQYASSTLPTLEEHLKLAESTNTSIAKISHTDDKKPTR